MSFEGKVIALTGAGQGIGLATAKILAGRGASVSLADANSTTLAEVEKEFKANGWPILVTVVDVRKSDQVNDWIAATVEKFGRLDGAANIAGTVGKQWGTAPITEVEDDDFALVMAVNVTGTLSHELNTFAYVYSDDKANMKRLYRSDELSTCRIAVRCRWR